MKCSHPDSYTDPETGETYCFVCVKQDARARCIERGEGWRWGEREIAR